MKNIILNIYSYKSVFKICAAILMGFGFLGCDDFLEEQPQGLLNPDTFVNSSANAEALLLSCYANLRYHPERNDMGMHYWRGVWHFSEMSTDDLTPIFRIFPPAIYTVDPNYSVLARTWEEYYSVINRTNTVINRLENVEEIDEALRNQYIGEARFLRAFMYFKLVRFWGGVPLILNETTSLDDDKILIGRSTDVEVYEQIETDLLFAELNALESHSGIGRGRATRNAAKALLSKVYLQWAGNPINDGSKWQLASDKASEVNGCLVEDYADVFSIANEGNCEILFELECTSGFGTVWNPAQGSVLSRTSMPRSRAEYTPDDGGFRASGTNDYVPSNNLYNSFSPIDARRDLVDSTYVLNGTEYTFDHAYFWKFLDPGTVDGSKVNWDSGVNYPFLRYADILLVEAEALNEMGYSSGGKAFELINSVRNRAGLANLDPLDVPDQESFRQAIIDERRKELHMEESRRYDLIRHGIAVDILREFAINDEVTFDPANINEERLLLPIPQNELDSNSALEGQQNPGY